MRGKFVVKRKLRAVLIINARRIGVENSEFHPADLIPASCRTKRFIREDQFVFAVIGRESRRNLKTIKSLLQLIGAEVRKVEQRIVRHTDGTPAVEIGGCFQREHAVGVKGTS